MSNAANQAQEIARFLGDNPDFFLEHADLFSQLQVPHPHKAGAISLAERQIIILRERIKQHEHTLAELMHNAGGNQRTAQALIDWCSGLLSLHDPQKIPAYIVQSLAQIFNIDSLALRIWGLGNLRDEQYTQEVSASIRQQTAAMQLPACGPQSAHETHDWFASKPASLALIPLRNLQDDSTIGLLALGSNDANRFNADMGTDFLAQIAHLASAALGRLLSTGPDSAA